MLPDLLYGVLATVVYLVMGVGLLVAGFLALDAVTPGRLGDLLMGRDGTAGTAVPPSPDAGVLAAASMLATGVVVFTALWTNVHDGLGRSVLWTLVFGLLGVAAQTASFKVVDLLTPGDLGAVVTQVDRPGHQGGSRLHPATLLAAAAQLATAGVVVAAIA